MSDLLTYHTYPNPSVAQELLEVLDAQGILYKTDYSPARFSGVLGTTNAEQFVVRLRPEDFTRVRQLEEEHAANSLADLPADYYLFAFTNKELWAVLGQPEAWSGHDVALATRLLRERGESVTTETLDMLRASHTAVLSVPDPSPTGLIMAGYAFAALGGLIGIAIGWSLWKHYKTLPDGQQVPAYSAHDRTHGRRIMLIGGIVLVLGLLARWMQVFG